MYLKYKVLKIIVKFTLFSISNKNFINLLI